MTPVPVKKLTCDGEAFKCTADLVSGSLFDASGWFLQCLVGLGRWKLGSSVGHCCLPPEPLLSQERRAQWVRVQNVESRMSSRISPECRAQQSKSTHRRVFVIWCCRNMPDVLYCFVNGILMHGIWILLWNKPSYVCHDRVTALTDRLGRVWHPEFGRNLLLLRNFNAAEAVVEILSDYFRSWKKMLGMPVEGMKRRAI